MKTVAFLIMMMACGFLGMSIGLSAGFGELGLVLGLSVGAWINKSAKFDNQI